MAQLAQAQPKTVIRISTREKPTARQFLEHYFAMDRPHTSGLYLSKGIVDFLLGLLLGILIGILIAIIAGVA